MNRGQIIRWALQREGRTQEWLADALGVSQSTVSRYIRNPTLATLERIHRVLPIPEYESLAEPFWETEGKTPEETSDSRRVSLHGWAYCTLESQLHQLGEEEQEALIGYIRRYLTAPPEHRERLFAAIQAIFRLDERGEGSAEASMVG